VLVIDDARFFREMICDLLADLPIRLETAGDGEEALQKIRSMHPALILVDLNIPGLSGQELIATVRRDPACQTVRILAMSGVQRGEETALDIRRLGADDFINKSFKPRDLQSRVRQFLGL
jgi:CheY-like chemotaxis protein